VFNQDGQGDLTLPVLCLVKPESESQQDRFQEPCTAREGIIGAQIGVARAFSDPVHGSLKRRGCRSSRHRYRQAGTRRANPEAPARAAKDDDASSSDEEDETETKDDTNETVK